MMGPRFHLALTRARYAAARWRMRGRDMSALAAYRAQAPDAVFYIAGAGATLNDLSEADLARIEGATSAAMSMTALAPIDFDIYAMEAILSDADCDLLIKALSAKGKPGLIWYQDRAKHETPQTKRLEAAYPFLRYARASVSIKRNIDNFRYAWAHFIRARVIETPDLGVSFALTGTVARLVLLALSLGYRRIGFVGVDLGATPYFWLEDRPIRGKPPLKSATASYNTVSTGAVQQGSAGVVPNVYDLLAEITKTDPGVTFFTLDPANRSNLTAHLRGQDINNSAARIVQTARGPL